MFSTCPKYIISVKQQHQLDEILHCIDTAYGGLANLTNYRRVNRSQERLGIYDIVNEVVPIQKITKDGLIYLEGVNSRNRSDLLLYACSKASGASTINRSYAARSENVEEFHRDHWHNKSWIALFCEDPGGDIKTRYINKKKFYKDIPDTLKKDLGIFQKRVSEPDIISLINCLLPQEQDLSNDLSVEEINHLSLLLDVLSDNAYEVLLRKGGSVFYKDSDYAHAREMGFDFVEKRILSRTVINNYSIRMD